MPNGSLGMKVGDKLRVIVEENPSVGAVWLVRPPSNKGVIDVERNSFEFDSSRNDDDQVGVRGKRTVIIRADNEGQEEFVIVEARIWEFKGFDDINSSREDLFDFKIIPISVYQDK